MKKLLSVFLTSILIITPALQAQELDDAKIREEIEAAHIEQLFNLREEKPFKLAVEKARKDGINEQFITEATFLYHVDRQDYKAIAKISEEFEKKLNTFDPDLSLTFSTKADWESVIEYGKALKALEADSLEDFKKHITEAFWLSPNTAGAFAHHITKIRVANAMKSITLNQDRVIRQITDDKEISLKTMLKDKDALILRYWSPWNQQAESIFPIVQDIAKQSAKLNVSFASILITPEQRAIDDSKEVIEAQGDDFPSLWLADSERNSLAKKLLVSDLPTLIIISKEGKILYNGSPLTDEFWNTLKTLNQKFKAPLAKP